VLPHIEMPLSHKKIPLQKEAKRNLRASEIPHLLCSLPRRSIDPLESEATTFLARHMLMLPLKTIKSGLNRGQEVGFLLCFFLFGLVMEPCGPVFASRAWSSSTLRRSNSLGPSCSSLFIISEPGVTRAMVSLAFFSLDNSFLATDADDVANLSSSFALDIAIASSPFTLPTSPNIFVFS